MPNQVRRRHPLTVADPKPRATFDEYNAKGAEILKALRKIADQSLEEFAEQCGENLKTAWAREKNQVDLGALRAVMVALSGMDEPQRLEAIVAIAKAVA